jgi:hypothetical protein
MFYTEKASLAASTPENKWKFHPLNTPTTVHRLVEAEQAPQGSHHHINKQGVGQGAGCLVLVLRAAQAKARRARGINRVKVGSLDRRLHAPQNTALTTLANAQQQCNGIAEKRSYTEQQRKLLLSWGASLAAPQMGLLPLQHWSWCWSWRMAWQQQQQQCSGAAC